MMKIINKAIILCFLILLFSCDKNKVDDFNPYKKTLKIGHKATGSGINNLGLKENTFEAIKYGYEYLDGIEIDVVMSKEQTLWIHHDATIVNCNNDTVVFYELTDTEIEEINKCNKGTIVSLKTVFEYLSKVDNKKFVSLDIKIINDDNCKIESKQQLVANKIVSLYETLKPNAIIGIESWEISFLRLIEKYNSDLETFLLCWDNFNENDIKYACQNQINGFSCRFQSIKNREIIDEAKRQNLKIQIWTVNDVDDIEKVIYFNPFSLQTDNIDFFIKN